MPYQLVQSPCPTHVYTPAGSGPWPAVVMYMDAGGIRPAMLGMAERLCQAGFVVALPDLFWRYGPYGPLVPAEVFKGDAMAILGPLLASTSPAQAAADSGAVLAWLSAQPYVAPGPVGAVGFCMGAGLAIASAAAYPEQFAVVASFHGGNLATDAPDSPHLHLPQVKARLYLAVAEADPHYPPAMGERFEAALQAAGVAYSSAVYAGAQHGWMMPDFPVYAPAAAERGWAAMLTSLA